MRKFFLFLQMLAASLFLAAEEGELPVNFHVVSTELKISRSGQPTAAQFRELARRGDKSVLNLRHFHSDARKLLNSGLTEYRLRLNAGSVSEKDLRNALEIVQCAPKPILIHCWHGSNRTGVVVAAGRIVFENWTLEQALAEMVEPRYGHHAGIYGNLPELLRKVDWQAMRDYLNRRAKLLDEFQPEEVLQVEFSDDGLLLAGRVATTPEEVRSAAIVRESKPRLILAICRKPVDPEMARPLLQTLLDRPEFTGVPAAVAAPVSRPAPGDELLSSRFGLRGCRVEPFPPASKRD